MEPAGKIAPLKLAVGGATTVSARVGIPEWWPSGHRAGVVLAHDVGADMDQPLLAALQESLVASGFLTIRFNFPFVENKRKRPDPAPILERTYRTAMAALSRDPEEAPAQIILAGFGLGARVAADVIAGGTKADGLVSISYPLHPSGKPSKLQADALYRIICPILFVQGSRDQRCRIDRLAGLQRQIGAPTKILQVEDADQNLALIKRSTRTPDEVREQLLGSVHDFLRRTTGPGL
jgi:predicted alpha/beta-hydrolase family hydrolase